jgi:hypothetical protein
VVDLVVVGEDLAVAEEALEEAEQEDSHNKIIWH